ARAEPEEIQIAATRTEALHDTLERSRRAQVQQRAQAAQRAAVVRREDVETAEAAQQHDRRAPRADAGQPRENLGRGARIERVDIGLDELARGDELRERAQRLGLRAA